MKSVFAKIINYWHNESDNFDSFYSRRFSFFSPKKLVSRLLENRSRFLHILLGDLDLGEKVLLDLGCGPGVHMVELAPRCCRIVGVDIEPAMLRLARWALALRPQPNWELVECDAANLVFADESFDVVFALGLLDYVSDPSAVLKESRRVLKKGGIFIFTIPKRPSPFSFFRSRVGLWLRYKIFGLPPILNVVSRDQLIRMIAEAGFTLRGLESIWSTMWTIKAIK